MGFIKSLRTNLAASKQRIAGSSSSAAGNDRGSQISNSNSIRATPPRSSDRRVSSDLIDVSQVSDVDDDDVKVPAEDAVSSSSIARASSRRSIDYAAAGSSLVFRERRSNQQSNRQSSLGGPGHRRSLDEPRLLLGRSQLAGRSDLVPSSGRRMTSFDCQQRPWKHSSRGSVDGSGHRGQGRRTRRSSLDLKAVASPSPISSSRSSWYGPYYSSQAPPTGQLPSLINNQDHAASRPLALRGTRSLIRFPSTSSVVGDEVPADAIRRTPRKSVSSRAVLIQGTGDVPSDTLREALDIGHFSIGGSIDGVRNDIYETAAQSMNVGSHKSLSPAKYSQNDNASLTVRSNGNLSGHDPRQRAAVFEETMEKLFHINEGDYYKEQVVKMTRKEDEEQKQRDAEKEAERFARAQRELQENDVKKEEQLWQKLRKEKRKLTVGGIGKLMMKMKGLKEEARDRVEKKKTGAKMDPAAVDAAKKDIATENKLKAVFSSFSQYGKWDPQQMVLPQHAVKGMSGLKFLSVCRRAGLVDDDCITPRLIRDLFSIHMDTATSLLSFNNFVIAITELSEMNHWKEEDNLKAVMDINAEGIMHIRAEDYYDLVS